MSKMYINGKTKDSELRKKLENLYNSEVPYAVVGDAGIYLHLDKEPKNNIVEILAKEEKYIEGTTLINKEELKEFSAHYNSIIDTAENITLNDLNIKTASIPYLVSDNLTRELDINPVIELAKEDKFNRETVEEIRSLFKATDSYEKNWPDFLQLLYDFAPNFIQ